MELRSLRIIISRINYPLYIKISLIYQGILRIFFKFGLRKDKHIYLTLNDLLKNKRSDTVFIFGNGSSINRYSIKVKNHINQNDIICLNYGMMNGYKPNFYFVELDKNQKENMKIVNNLNLLNDEFKKTIVIYKDGDFIKNNLNNFKFKKKLSIRVLRVDSVPINSYKNFNFLSKFLVKEINYFRNNGLKVPTIYSKRASIFSIINFANLLGYKKIVLCGVELNNNIYYYDSKRLELIKKGFQFPPKINNGIHKRNNPESNTITIDKLIYFYNDFILKDQGIKLFIATKNSVLSDRLPLYFGNN
jgi:hypothetical protein